MSCIDTLDRILSNKNLINYPFKFCLVDKNKLPFTINNTMAKPNNFSDFVALEEISNCQNIEDFMGIGVSIQASNVCAIDVDSCFKDAFVENSIDERGAKILEIFGNLTYCEFSFSGKGMRILFNATPIENYQELYYIKNDKNHCEYYQPLGSARYVTLTGRYIRNNPINNINLTPLLTFLDTFMKRQYKRSNNKEKLNSIEDRELEELLRKVRNFVLKDFKFQEIWLDENHDKDIKGQSLESNNDYYILKYLYDNLTTDKFLLKEIFETSPYFKSKDKKHINKWNYNNNRYYNYVYSTL